MSNPSNAYAMTLSLNVLEHLGINLYSNVPSVLSEVVANAWDADAEQVKIALNIGQDTIIMTDDGVGMDRADVNKRFLKVGYQRRLSQPPLTTKNRQPMGRKGIGKLSLFSIANIVEVHTVKNGEKSALRMHLKDIRDQISDKDAGVYHPVELDTELVDITQGTRIILKGLRRKKTISTAKALRRRIARRFSIISSDENFSVLVDDLPITPSDRDYYDKVQFLWTYGGQTEISDQCVNLSKDAEDRTQAVSNGKISVSGWLGTVRESRHLKDEESGDNLNRIAIFMRGKMAQEDILDDFSERGVYAGYLIGELRVDALDDDSLEDAATSSRQKLVEDDERYVELKEVLGAELKHIQNRWSEWRKEEGVKKALEIPAVASWVEALPKPQRGKAKLWLGKIYKIKTDSPDERKELIKHAIFAFEFYRANENLETLETISEDNLDAALEVFRELDSLEANLYGQIVKQRISTVRALQEQVEENAKEKVIQEYIFDHLWLLDASWERAEATEYMEKRVDKIMAVVDKSLTPEQRAARIDIGYRKTAGKHVIVELKRPGRSVGLYELAEQISKYKTAMTKLLEELKLGHEQIEIVCLLGDYPKEWSDPGGKDQVENTLRTLNARVLLYGELLDQTFKIYNDYLQNRKSIDRLDAVIAEIDDYAEG